MRFNKQKLAQAARVRKCRSAKKTEQWFRDVCREELKTVRKESDVRQREPSTSNRENSRENTFLSLEIASTAYHDESKYLILCS